jgi:hypothetical protein
MALTFPLSLAAFADTLPIASNPFILEEMQELSIAGSGETIAATLAPSRWTSPVMLARMVHTKARAVQARLEAMSGPVQSFFLHCVTNSFPAADPGGEILGEAAVTIHAIGGNNRSLRLTGLPAGYVLSPGDALAFSYGSNPVRRAWHRLAEGSEASSGGLTPLFELSTPLRPGVAEGLAITLKKPAAKMFIVPKSVSVSHTARHSTISFQAMQRP